MSQISIFDLLTDTSGLIERPGINGGPAIRISEENIAKAKALFKHGVELPISAIDHAEAYGVTMMAWILELENSLTFLNGPKAKNNRNLWLEMPYKINFRGVEFEVVR